MRSIKKLLNFRIRKEIQTLRLKLLKKLLKDVRKSNNEAVEEFEIIIRKSVFWLFSCSIFYTLSHFLDNGLIKTFDELEGFIYFKIICKLKQIYIDISEEKINNDILEFMREKERVNREELLRGEIELDNKK